MLPFAASEHVDNQQGSADGDATVGDVEVGEILALARMELDEIGDGVAYDAVVEISERAAEDEGQRDPHQPIAPLAGFRTFEQNRSNNDEDCRGKAYQNEGPDRTAGFGKESESDTWVFIVYDVEKAGDNRETFRGQMAGADQVFG